MIELWVYKNILSHEPFENILRKRSNNNWPAMLAVNGIKFSWLFLEFVFCIPMVKSISMKICQMMKTSLATLCETNVASIFGITMNMNYIKLYHSISAQLSTFFWFQFFPKKSLSFTRFALAFVVIRHAMERASNFLFAHLSTHRNCINFLIVIIVIQLYVMCF